jgi:hypothetical protein
MFGESGRMTPVERAAELFRQTRNSKRDTPARLVRALADTELMVRQVAAIELARKWPARLPDAAVRELLETLARLMYGEGRSLDIDYEEATATEDDSGALAQDIVLALANLRCGQAGFAIPRLLEFWSFSHPFYELGHALIALAFPVSKSKAVVPRRLGMQYQVLQALVVAEDIWQFDGDWSALLKSRGLPTTRKAMYKFLGYRDA